MSKNKKIVLVIIVLGIILRLLHWVLPVMDSDMAVTGLMARHILKGEFPVFFWGQNYCGAIEAYLVALFFAIFGASRYALNIVPVLESILFMIVMYILARRAFGEKVGILTLLLIAIPPRYLVVNTVLARANYVENLVLGAIVFYLTYRIVYEEKGINSGKLFFLLGIIFGLAWWTNFQSIYFILTSLFFIFLRKKLIFFTRRFLILLLGVFIGGSPFWYFCFTNDFSPFKSIGEEKFTNIAIALKKFFVVGLPVIFGVVKSNREIYIPVMSHLLLIIYIVSFIFIVKDRFKGLLYLGKFSLRKSNGIEMFIVFFLLFTLLYTLSGYGTINTRRYMLVLYLCLPVFLAYFVGRLRQRQKKISIFILSFILIANGQQNIVSIDLFNKYKRKTFIHDQRNEKELFKFLEDIGIKYVYVNNYWLSYQYTFDAQEKIFFTEWNPSRYPKYFEATHRSENVAFYFPGNEPAFDQMLRNIGTESFKRKSIAGGSLYYDFVQIKRNYEKINVIEAEATSNYNQDEANYALDRDLTTRWTTKTRQVPGMYFELDLGKAKEISRIILDLNGSPDDYPRGYILSSSLDGKNWQDIIVSNINWGDIHWGDLHPVMNVDKAKFEICFEPHLARFIKIDQTGSHDVYWWSIHEIKLYGPEGYLNQEEVTFRSEDLDLKGYIYRSSKLNDDSPLPIIILSHGSNPDGQQKFFYRELAKRFAKMNYLVFTFDYRGFGESDDPPDITKVESFNWKQDLESAIEYVMKKCSIKELILMGHSFGAASTLAVGIENNCPVSHGDPREGKLVLISPPRRMKELFFDKKPILGLEWLQKRIKKDMKLKNFPPKEILEEIHQPYLLENFQGQYFTTPVLFIDEGNALEEDLEFITDLCDSFGGDVTRIILPDTEHYFAAEHSLQIQEAMDRLIKVIDDWINKETSENPGLAKNEEKLE